MSDKPTTWSLPPEPPIGTLLRDGDGREWVRDNHGHGPYWRQLHIVSHLRLTWGGLLDDCGELTDITPRTHTGGE